MNKLHYWMNLVMACRIAQCTYNQAETVFKSQIYLELISLVLMSILIAIWEFFGFTTMAFVTKLMTIPNFVVLVMAIIGYLIYERNE